MNSIIKPIIFSLFTIVQVMVLHGQPVQTDNQIYEFVVVDEKPVVLRDAQPVYPQSALNAGVEGTVVVTIVVDKNGMVTDATIFSSIPQLDNAALQAARGKVFSPGQIAGSPVFTRMNIPINFTLPVDSSILQSSTSEEPGDFVDLTGEAVRITIEPERPRVNIIADRIKPEFDMMNLERSFLPELTGKGEKIVVVDPKARISDDQIDIENIINRSR